MTTTAKLTPQLVKMSHVPSDPYRTITPRHTDRLPTGPFHASAYMAAATVDVQPRTVQRAGFPGAEKEEVRAWIPGVSSPEGIVLVTGLAAMMTGGGDLVVKAAQVVASGIVVGVTAGIPTAAVYMAHNIR